MPASAPDLAAGLPARRRSRPVRRVAGGCLLALLALAGVLAVRAFGGADATPPPPAGAPVSLDTAAAVQRLAAALRFRTISHAEPALAEPGELAAFQEHLRASFPRVHATLQREAVAGGSLLYTWPGADRVAPPVLLLAHQDVVPVADAAGWTHPPFAGVVAGGYVWGRGAMDDKHCVLGILEAVEALLARGYQPPRTVHLAFGHDEELGGDGARAIAELLARRGVRLAMVLDEGGFFTRGLVPGLAGPAALVGIAEKGYLSLELTVENEGGHSSRPPRDTAIGVLARAVARLEEEPFPARLDGASRASLETMAPYLAPPQRLVLSNLWLLEPLAARMLAGEPNSAVMVRTTTALTVFTAGEKDNVLPRRARAVVNFRILPGDTVAGVTARVREVIEDSRVTVRPLAAPDGSGGERPLAVEPSPISRTDGPEYRLLEQAIRDTWGEPGLVVAPFLFTGATDARHFSAVSDHVYRFMALTITPEDVARFHGVDERIAVDAYRQVVELYYRLLLGLDALGSGTAPARP